MVVATNHVGCYAGSWIDDANGAGLISACVLGLLCKHENLLCSHLAVDHPKVMSLFGREGKREDKGVKDSPRMRHL